MGFGRSDIDDEPCEACKKCRCCTGYERDQETVQQEVMKTEMKENRIVESLRQVDFSGMGFPMVTIYEKPGDFPDAFVARVWDGKGPKPANVMIKRSTVQEIREDIAAAGFSTVFQRAEDDDPHIVETWI